MRSHPVVRMTAAILTAAGLGCPSLDPPETRVLAALEQMQPSSAPAFLVRGARMQVQRVAFSRLLVKREGEGFTAVATVDAEAQLEGGPSVSYLGLERIPFQREDGTWRPRGPVLPALAQMVELMQRKAEAYERGDAAALEGLVAQRWEDGPRDRRVAALREELNRPIPQPKAARWFIRVEREGAELLEEVPGEQGPERRRYRLVREAEGFRFASGLR